MPPALAGSVAGHASERARPVARPRARTRLLSLCLSSAAVALAAWTAPTQPTWLSLLILLPALVFRAAGRRGAFLVAFSYYAVGAHAVPGIIHGFFPQVSPFASALVWAGHAALLALPWALAFAPARASAARRAAGVIVALLVLSLPPIGLFHWASPLLVAGLLFPGWGWAGLAITAGALAGVAAAAGRTYKTHAALAAIALLAVGANALYREPTPPQGWRAISLESGKNPPLWSDEMAARRRSLADRALQELSRGAKVVIFPEAISGSSRRAQADVWAPVSAQAKARGATVLVGEEAWNGARTAFRNALVGFGTYRDGGAVVVSSLVPMPMGDWKFGLPEGAETNLFGDNVVALHGRKVAFSMCYEDFLLWPHRGLLAGDADLLVSSANQWPSAGTSAEVVQDVSRVALARLAGVALLTAKNR